MNSANKHGSVEELNSNYNDLYLKYKNLLTQREDLENTLRQETITNEEQRNRIQILKKALAEKFQSVSLSKVIEEL